MPSRYFYFVHPAAGLDGPFDRAPGSRTAERLGIAWQGLSEPDAEEREAVFFGRLFRELLSLWARVQFRGEFASSETPHRLAGLSGVSQATSNEAAGELTYQSIDVLIQSGPTYLEFLVDEDVRLSGEPWDGLAVHLTREEVQALHSALR